MSHILYRKRRRLTKYKLAEDYTIQTSIFPEKEIVTTFIYLTVDGLLTLKKGYAWDGPSGPMLDTKDMLRGSLVHDAFYQLMRLGLLDYKKWKKPADKKFIKIYLEDANVDHKSGFLRRKGAEFRAWYALKGLEAGGTPSCKTILPEPVLRAP